MKKTVLDRFWPIALSLLLSPLAIASEQEPVSSFVDRVDVEVVNVEVFVTDQEGRRVTGLTREDFELYEDGRPVEITNFYTVERPPAEVAAEPSTSTAQGEVPRVVDRRQVPEEQKLRLMVFIDYFNISPNHRNRVLAPLDEFLAERLDQGDMVMLAGFDGSIKVIQPFTDDRRQIDEGIKKIRRSVTQLPSRQMASKLASRWARLAAMHGDKGGAAAHIAGQSQEQRLNLQHSINALDDAVRSLGTLPGRKAILYISDGIQGVGDGPNRRPLIRRIPRTANAHLVTFYALDARGATDESLSAIYSGDEVGGDMRTVAEALQDMRLQEPLFMMARPTGGSVIINTFNFAGTLRRIGEDFDTFYSLGYASRSSGNVKYHKIEVKLRRPELSVRHRSGYLEKPLSERVADRTLSSLILDRDANPLGIDLNFGEPEKKRSDEFLLPILVRIPTHGVSLLPRDEVVEGRLRIYLAVGDEAGRFSSVQDVPYP
ncbi:MAG: VWA domain-containing protein, partial [bacterium]|nr:VWA domain-containing protein [bacterium]